VDRSRRAESKTMPPFKRVLQRPLGFAVALIFMLAAFIIWQWKPIHDFVNNLMPAALSADSALPNASALRSADSKSLNSSESSSDIAKKSLSQTQPSTEDESFLATVFRGHTPQVCGLTEAEAKAYVASNGFFDVPIARRGLADAVSKFVQSKDLREKTLGLYLLAHLANEATMESERLNFPGCTPSSACFFDKPYEAMLKARPANAEPLVKLALSSNDVDLYAAALYACSGDKTGSCGLVKYERWAEMEPDNAFAWLMVASEAESRKDSATRTAALQSAAAAKGYDSRVPSMAAVFEAESVQVQSATAQMAILGALTQINSATGFKPMSGWGRHCGVAESMDEDRRITCEALATKVAEKSETLIGIRMASTIGERVGWSSERLQQLKDEYAVATGKMWSEFSNLDKNMFTCDTLAKTNESARKLLKGGERQMTRDLVKSSGKSLAELAEGYRKTIPNSVK
jgi:hypothetical protein